jgi:hypothetical protein
MAQVTLLVQAEAVKHVARKDDESRAARAEGNRLALEVVDRPGGRFGAHDEHARRGVHREENGQRSERLQGNLTLDERDVELPGLEQRDVLGTSLGVTRLHVEGRVGGVDGLRDGLAVDGKAATGRGGAQHDGCPVDRGAGHRHPCQQRESRSQAEPTTLSRRLRR